MKVETEDVDLELRTDDILSSPAYTQHLLEPVRVRAKNVGWFRNYYTSRILNLWVYKKKYLKFDNIYLWMFDDLKKRSKIKFINI